MECLGILAYIALCFCVCRIAKKKGQSAFLAFIFSLLCTPFAWVIVTLSLDDKD